MTGCAVERNEITKNTTKFSVKKSNSSRRFKVTMPYIVCSNFGTEPNQLDYGITNVRIIA